ncbi:hypothetical protein M2R47_08540 [Moraxella sp. Tifton1]|uniref:Uncharacterized protein n=1 Tax=Moraxella oculi TaxID=2940516 RepID=A0ABW8UDC2_9GAMM|nr:hypothetical protein [Moraxella sp. Tifton1]MCL1624280.1 hypothetical protein [Moraxella sp. Tifton1]
MKKSIFASVALGAVASMLAISSASAITPDRSGWCTREYDPVPYVTKDGKRITAPNECVAKHWKSQGR